MTGFRHLGYGLPVFFLLTSLGMADVKQAEQSNTAQFAVTKTPGLDHRDPIEVDSTLSLSKVIDLTMEKYPDQLINEALVQEADALGVRAGSWVAGSNALYVDYFDDTVTNNRGYSNVDVKLEVTPWFWGQRSAAQEVANQAQASAHKQSVAIRLEVCRLVREALWAMTLADIRLQQAKYTLDMSGQLLEKVRLRVELGDLARTDLLLAESENLQNRSLFIQAEAEMMHSRKNYANLTRITSVPASFNEQQSPIDNIRADHPLLEAINAIIARKQATIEWAKNTDTINQPKLNIGAQSTHDPAGGGNSQITGIGVVIPFGHSTYDAPEIAAANLEYNRALAQREHLMRALEKNLHEAEHGLELSREELAIAHQLKQIAEAHLKMTEVSFAAGEINLLDLLKIQARSLEAIRKAREQEVKYQHNIALYNQAVGVMP
jgi:outer membrane protein TolC